MKVSSRTYQDEIRRRNESKPVQVIDFSKLQESTSKCINDEFVNKPIDKPANKPIDKPANNLVCSTSVEKQTKLPDYVCILIYDL